VVATPRKLTSAHLRVYKPIDALQHNPSRQAVETPTTQPTKANPLEKDSVPADCLGGRLRIRLWSKRDVARVRKLLAVRRKRRNNEEAYKWPSNRSHFSIWQVVVWALAKR